MSDASIRRARPADRDDALALWRALHREHEALDDRYRLAPDAFLRWANDFDEWAREAHHLVLLAEAGEEAVGLLTVHLAFPSPVYVPALFAHVDDLYVRPGWRGRGVGGRLLEEAARWARKAGATSLQAGVLASNEEGRAFWTREGALNYAVTVAIRL